MMKVAKIILCLANIVLLFICLPIATGGEINQYQSEDIKSIKIDNAEFEVLSSTTLISKKGNIYSVRNLFDNNLETAWVSKFDKKSGKIPAFRIIFKEPVYIKSITVYNGYQKSMRLYDENQRAKVVYIMKRIIGNVYEWDHEFKISDTIAPQELSLQKDFSDSVNLFKVKEIIVNVNDIYEGSRYQDLSIAEMKINVEKDIAYKPSVTWKELKRIIEGSKTKVHRGWDAQVLSFYSDKADTLLADLLYYVLKGNIEARQYLDTYSPQAVSDSEFVNICREAIKESLPKDTAPH